MDSSLLNAALCVILLRGELGGLVGSGLLTVLAKVSLASAAMTAAVLGANRSVSTLAAGGGTLTHAAALLLAIGAGLLTLLLAARLLRIEEFETLSAEARSKVGKLLSR